MEKVEKYNSFDLRFTDYEDFRERKYRGRERREQEIEKKYTYRKGEEKSIPISFKWGHFTSEVRLYHFAFEWVSLLSETLLSLSLLFFLSFLSSIVNGSSLSPILVHSYLSFMMSVKLNKSKSSMCTGST